MLIKDELKIFVSSMENNGALLITGEWGCGKSYLIKKCVQDMNCQKQYAVALISLFGVDNIATLNLKVRDAYLEFTSVAFGLKAQKIFGALKKVAKDSAKITAAAIPDSAAAAAVSMGVSSVLSFNPLNFIAVKKTVGQGEKQREFVLVFDDFERCNINIVDLLGAINEYAENKDIKVVIIADESKIKADKYKEFKEKVVARTLKMSSNYTEIIDSIIEKYKTTNSKYKQFLLESKSCVVGAFSHSGYGNLRALKACLMDFERVFNSWCQVGIPLDEIEQLFYKFCVITYETKKGFYGVGPYEIFTIITNDKNQEERDAAVKEIKAKYMDDAFNYIPTSISKWVVLGEWDNQTFQNEIRGIYSRGELSHEEKFIQHYFWDLDQADIDHGMPALVKRAYNGDASRDELITLLQKTHALKIHGIMSPCEVDYKKLDQGLEKRFEKVKKGEIQEPSKHRFTENSEIDREAIPINQKIEKMGERMHIWEHRNALISYLLGNKRISQYQLKNMCIDTYDEELHKVFVAKYLSSDNSARTHLCRVIMGLDFTNTYYSTPSDLQTTLKYFDVLISTLKGLIVDNSTSIDNVIHKYFIKHLEQRVEEISGLD